MDDIFSELKKLVAKFVNDRDWRKFHTAKNLSMSIAIESAELMEHFQWLTNKESNEYIQDDKQKIEVAYELADIMIYCIAFANIADINLEKMIREKMRINNSRFPAGKAITD